jgi:hypothetical protein
METDKMEEENNHNSEIQEQISPEEDFVAGLESEDKLFVGEFLKQGVCFRCILMMFKIFKLKIYRIADYSALASHFPSS